MTPGILPQRASDRQTCDPENLSRARNAPPHHSLVASAPAVGHNDYREDEPPRHAPGGAAGRVRAVDRMPARRCAGRRPSPPTRPRRPQRLHALLLNGGGRREINFQSHLTHVRGVVRCSRTAACRRRNITIFSGDGADPAADLATRETRRTSRTSGCCRRSLARPCARRSRYVDSTLAGFVLHPATREALRAWFLDQGSTLGSGDTLLLLRHRPRRD